MKATWANVHLRTCFFWCMRNSGVVWASTMALLIWQSHLLIIDCSGPWGRNPTGGLQTDIFLLVLNLYSTFALELPVVGMCFCLALWRQNRKEKKKRDERDSQRNEKVKFPQSSCSNFLEQSRELVHASSLLIHCRLRAFTQLLLLFWVTGNSTSCITMRHASHLQGWTHMLILSKTLS